MTTVNIHEAKTHLSRLIERVLTGEPVTIAKAGKPLVDLVVHRSSNVVTDGWAGRVEYDDATFDDTDPQVADAFGGSAR